MLSLRTIVSNTLLIVDGHNICIRAYFGLVRQQLRTKDGVGTWGLYGSINTLTSQVKKYNPTHIAVTMDWGKSSKRTALYPEYKANRTSNGQDENYQESREQVRLFREFCKLSNIPVIRFENVEADDIMAKLVKTYHSDFDKIVILTADHDIRQLIDEKVIVVKPSLGQSRDIEEQTFDLQSIVDNYGIKPNRLPEIWALTGDRGDNVPGVPSIGEKTAMKLLTEFGSLSNLLMSDHKKINEHKEIARLSYKLVQLDGLDDLDIPSLDRLEFKPVRIGKVGSGSFLDFIEKYELNSIKSRWLVDELWDEERPIGRRLSDG